MSNWTIWAKTPAEWDIALQKFPSHNLYQSAKWGEFKETSGWAIMRMVCTHAGEIQTMAQALVKQAPLSSMIVWIPGGPKLKKRLKTDQKRARYENWKHE